MFASLTDVKVLHILKLWLGLTPPPRTFVPHDSAAPFAKHPENHTSNFKNDSHNFGYKYPISNAYSHFFYAQYDKKIVKGSNCQIVNAISLNP